MWQTIFWFVWEDDYVNCGASEAGLKPIWPKSPDLGAVTSRNSKMDGAKLDSKP
jgi:hypothetical protein